MPGSHRLLVAIPLTLVGPLLLLPTAALPAQEARAVLHAPLAVLPIDSAPFQRLADLDGDGDLDAIGSRIHENSTTTQIVVWRNDLGGIWRLRHRGWFACTGQAEQGPSA